MSRLTVFAEDDPATPLVETSDPTAIAAALADIDVQFERWPTVALPADADNQAVLDAYAGDIARLSAAGGYRSCDVIRMAPDHPERTALRGKFLSEHTHGEDEVRFFVDGAGLFTLRGGGRVFNMLCERDDLIRVPAGIRHWFDMGESPRFTAIRLFTSPDGWVARFTGDAIADRFPRFAPA